MPAINLFQIFLFLFLWSVGLSLAQTDHFLVETSNTTQNYDASEVVGKSPSQIIRMRGYGAEIHYAKTKDGYHIHVVRIINPKIHQQDLKRPVIFNHGLLESSTIWLINSRGVHPRESIDHCGFLPSEALANNSTFFLNGPMMLANNGYDVWLMSMRGTDWSLKHETLKPQDSQFWNYCLDDFGLTDVPSVVDYVRIRTNSPKVGYIGHSQATFSIFALLSMRPEYADIIEPVIAVAPVSYFDHITSIARALFLGTLTATDKDHHGPFPPNAKKMRKLLTNICVHSLNINKLACDIMNTLISGEGRKILKGFFSHLPFYTSLKVLRHFGQLVKHKRFMMYDHGREDNLRIYGTEESPSYPIENIRSKYLCLISTKSDSLSPPKDVQHFKQQLRVPLYRDIFIDGEFNHFDLITDIDAKKLVFPQVFEIFESIERESGICSRAAEPVEALQSHGEFIDHLVEDPLVGRELVETPNVGSPTDILL